MGRGARRGIMRETVRRRITRRMAAALVLLALVALLAACGGGDDKQDSKTARNPTDPRRVPTATAPAPGGTPLAALEIGGARSPTLPEVYVVKAGDTIGVIAAELGISADALTRANPNLDPRGLRIGQELRVPRPTPTATATAVARGPATPTGTPGRSPTPTAAGTPGRSPSPTPAGSPRPTGSPTAVRTPTPAASPSSAAGTYTVVSGDTGCAIARKLGVSLTALAQANGLSVDGLGSLRVGQVLQVPRSTGEGPGC